MLFGYRTLVMGETEEETEEGKTAQVLFHFFPQPAVLYARALTGTHRRTSNNQGPLLHYPGSTACNRTPTLVHLQEDKRFLLRNPS